MPAVAEQGEVKQQSQQQGSVCPAHKIMEVKINEIHDALLGTYEKPGLINKINKHDGWIGNICKALWIIFGLAMTAMWGAFFRK